MSKKLILFVLVLSLVAFAQHGHGGMGGPPAGVGGGFGGHGVGEGHDTGGDRDKGSQSGPKSSDTLLNQNSKLSSNLEKLLPKGTTAQQACSGFKNLGQCVAAIHVSHNLGISFTDLKNKMTGTAAISLGKAIQELDPKVNAKAEAKKGKQQADEDIRQAKS